MHKATVENKSHQLSAPLTVEYCDTFLKRFLGLMLRSRLNPGEGIMLVEASESRMNTAIHMLFMNFDIAVIWLNSSFIVVDMKIARRWSLAHIPAKPAKFIMEVHPIRISDFQIGNQLSITNV